jgi:uncharacterized protein YfeS
VEKILKTADGEMNLTNSDMVTYAAAFAHIKITGQLDSDLKAMALNAIKRLEITAGLLGRSEKTEPSEIAAIMIRDLERF